MSRTTEEKSDAAMAAELDRLWLKYHSVNVARLAAVEAAIAAVVAGAALDAETVGEGRRAAHKLAGSLGMFGHTKASALARDVEQVLCSPVPDTGLAAGLAAAIRAEVHLSEPAADPLPPPAGVPAAGTIASVDVAIIEDDEVVAGLLTYALNKQGYTTEWISDGGIALRRFSAITRSLTARVIVLDVDLPGIDGMTLLRRFSADGLLRQSPVIMLTVRASESEVVKALQLGAADHVAKPFSLRVFLEKIRRTLER